MHKSLVVDWWRTTVKAFSTSSHCITIVSRQSPYYTLTGFVPRHHSPAQSILGIQVSQPVTISIQRRSIRTLSSHAKITGTCCPPNHFKSNQSINHLISQATQASFISINSSMAPAPPAVLPVKEQVLRWISDASVAVLVFSKTNCDYCDTVKNFLASLDIKAKYLELDQLSNGAEIQDILAVMTGQKTVPNVFIRGQHVGGCDTLMSMNADRLMGLVNGDLGLLPKSKKIPMKEFTKNGTSESQSKSSQIINLPPPQTPLSQTKTAIMTSSVSSLKSTEQNSPINMASEVQKWIHDATAPVVVFSKTTCPYCQKVKLLFDQLSIKPKFIEIDIHPHGPAIQQALLTLTGQKTVPNVFINGQHIGGCDATTKLHTDGKLLSLINPSGTSSKQLSQSVAPATVEPGSLDTNGVKYDYDLIIIGGGSGGLATSKEAARLGAKVAVFDFVQPTPIGTTWGLGGTCVNVGCIPKKLMHQAAILGELYEDSKAYGWEFTEARRHNWDKMVGAIQGYIHSLNWKYKVSLRDVNVTYLNSYAKFVGPHEVLATTAKGKESKLTAAKFVIATGGRPKYPDIPGAKEYGITSDDLFSLPYPPGKTLCVGASYVSLECGGFLQNLGFDTTIMVRSILLRGFDQQIAERIGEYMEKERKVKFIRGAIPTKIEQIEAGTPGRLRVTSDHNGKEIVEEYNTVLFAIGRDACTATIGLEKVGVKINPKSGKLVTTNEQTNVPHIYAIGDVLDGKPELTPVAIQAGTRLARRLFGGSTDQYDYEMIPTTVFTPLEYGAIGLAEEDALAKYGEDNIEVYHTLYRPLEWAVPGHAESHCYGKLICNKLEDERVVGLHILGPNAGEITQGYAVGMRLGATKRHFDGTTGIHPTQSEIFTTLTVTKRSGAELTASGC